MRSRLHIPRWKHRRVQIRGWRIWPLRERGHRISVRRLTQEPGGCTRRFEVRPVTFCGAQVADLNGNKPTRSLLLWWPSLLRSHVQKVSKPDKRCSRLAAATCRKLRSWCEAPVAPVCSAEKLACLRHSSTPPKNEIPGMEKRNRPRCQCNIVAGSLSFNTGLGALAPASAPSRLPP